MTKSNVSRTVVGGMVLGIAVILFIASGARSAAAAATPANNVAQSPTTPAPAAAPNYGDPAVLDAHRRLALGMIETGNRDDEIGGAGEVSRYQIMPSVWHQYSQSLNYQNPNVSLTVAQKHWARLYAAFVKKAHREPTDFDMYVLWNTHYGYYASKGFNPNRLAPAVRDRAQRYVNLVRSDDL
jgi:hypothetical protein